MKHFRLIISLLLLSLIIGNSCIEPIDPESLVFDDFLVVEALITDENKQQMVRLSRTFELDQDTIRLETGARVWVERNDGICYDFVELKQGQYYSDPFAAHTDFTYQLHIETSLGTHFESTPEIVKRSPPIKDISAQFTPDEDQGEGIFRLFLDTEESEQTKYFRWEWTETYRIAVNFHSTIFWDGSAMQNRRPSDELRFCFAFDTSSSVLVSSDL
jgi:hypothetical protein